MKKLLLLLSIGMTVSALATDYYLVRDQPAGANGWQASEWKDKDGNEATSEPCAGNTYYVLNDYGMRTPEKQGVNYTFEGKLIVGSATSGGKISNKTVSGGVITYADLVLVNAQYIAVNVNVTDKKARVAGKITVASPESAPASFKNGSNTDGLGYIVSADISGDEGTGLTVCGNDRYNVVPVLSGDNSGYHGKLVFDSNYEAANYVDITILADSPTALGGSLTAPRADAVSFVFDDDAKLSFTKNAGPHVAAENRGLSLKPTNANPVFYLDAEKDAAVDFAFPITGSNVAVKKTGLGTLTLSGAYGAGALSVAEGVLVLASESVIAALPVVNAQTWLKSPSNQPYGASGLAIDGGKVIVRYGEGTAATISLDATCSMSDNPLVLALEADDSVYDAEEIVMMKIPSAVRTVTAADFSFDRLSLTYGLPRFQIAVKDLGDGLQSVCLERLFPVVFRNDNNNNATYTTAGTTWSDGKAVHDKADYLIANGALLRTVAGTFKGESLTLGPGETLAQKGDSQDIGTVYMFPGSLIACYKGTGSVNNKPQLIDGDVTVYGLWDNPAVIGSHKLGMPTFVGQFHGDGVLLFRPNVGSDGGYQATVRSSNQDFKGKMRVAIGDKASMTLILGADNSVGGDLAAFDYRALTMTDKTTLSVESPVTLDAANRGVLVRGAVTFSLTDGFSLDVGQPVTWNGTLNKTGAGELVLGGRSYFENAAQDGVVDAPVAAGKNNALNLSEGLVTVANPAALTQVKVVAKGGSLGYRWSADYGKLGCEPETIDVSTADLSVLVDVADIRRETEIPLFTVDATTAASLAGKVHVYENRKSRLALPLATKAAEDGSGRVTFFATCAPRGLILLFR